MAGCVQTFTEGVRGQAGDLGHDREEVPQAGPLGLPALQDLEDALAQAPDLLLVTLQTPQWNVFLRVTNAWFGRPERHEGSPGPAA